MAQSPTILETRRIEARILKFVFDAVKEEEGEERARALLSKAIERAAEAAGREMAAKEKPEGPSARAFAAIQRHWRAGGALETRELRLDDDNFEYEVTRCAYAEMYREMGLMDLGFALSCLRDGSFVRGYAPDLEMERSGAIMLGDKACHFHYFRRKG